MSVVDQLKKALETPDGNSGAILQEEHYVERQHKKAYLQTVLDNNEARKEYAEKLFWLTCSWLIIVLIIVILNGDDKLHLSDAVLITLITTTTTNVLGFLF